MAGGCARSWVTKFQEAVSDGTAAGKSALPVTLDRKVFGEFDISAAARSPLFRIMALVPPAGLSSRGGFATVRMRFPLPYVSLYEFAAKGFNLPRRANLYRTFLVWLDARYLSLATLLAEHSKGEKSTPEEQ